MVFDWKRFGSVINPGNSLNQHILNVESNYFKVKFCLFQLFNVMHEHIAGVQLLLCCCLNKSLFDLSWWWKVYGEKKMVVLKCLAFAGRSNEAKEIIKYWWDENPGFLTLNNKTNVFVKEKEREKNVNKKKIHIETMAKRNRINVIRLQRNGEKNNERKTS